MPLPRIDELHQEASTRAPAVPVAVAGGADETVLAALRSACDRRWVAPIVAGPVAEVRQVAGASGIDLHGFRLVASDDPAEAAVAEVRAGRARLLMKGKIATPALMRAVLAATGGLRSGRLVCQVVLLEVCPAGRRFLLADTGICIQPSLAQKEQIVRHTVDVAHALGEPLPRVALMAATETVDERMPETVEAAELQRRAEGGGVTGCLLQGPLSFDLAYAASAADRKRIEGPVVGAADALVFPNLVSANLTVKAIMYTADSRFGGVLCGTTCPVVFMSRADSTATRLNSLAFALKLLAGPNT